MHLLNRTDEKCFCFYFRTGWTKKQNRLFDEILNALHAERLSRLAYDQHVAEPMLRRSSLDKITKRMRAILAQINWDTKLTQWLHGVLIENLSLSYLAAYLDVLQVEILK